MSLSSETPPKNQPEEGLYSDIFTTLKDVSNFLAQLKLASLSERHEQERIRLGTVTTELRLKVAEHVHALQRMDGVKSPRPVRKTSPSHPTYQDSLYTFSTQLHRFDKDERKKSLSPELLRRTSYSPEAKRRHEVNRPKIRPRSISCPEIKYTPPHTWKTSLPKVLENEEEDEGPNSPTSPEI